MNHIQLDPRSLLILRRCSLALLKCLVTDFKMCEIFIQKTWPIFNCNPVKTYVKILLKSLFNLGQYLVGKQLDFGATELHRGRGNLGWPCMGAMSHVTETIRWGLHGTTTPQICFSRSANWAECISGSFPAIFSALSLNLWTWDTLLHK